jgi:transcriptional regulator with XRE-family HTH domain
MSKDANQSEPGTGKHPDHYLAEWRRYRGWSQMELAEMVDVSHSKISRIETGETELKPSFLKKLARIFHIPPVAILTVNPQGEGRQTAEMLDVWAAIAPGKREDALSILRALATRRPGENAG